MKTFILLKNFIDYLKYEYGIFLEMNNDWFRNTLIGTIASHIIVILKVNWQSQLKKNTLILY